MNTKNLNPKFLHWLAAQSDAVKVDIEAKWEETGTHSDIAHADKNAYYARQHRTLEYAAAKWGYDFT